MSPYPFSSVRLTANASVSLPACKGVCGASFAPCIVSDPDAWLAATTNSGSLSVLCPKFFLLPLSRFRDYCASLLYFSSPNEQKFKI
jgi:hypothetical protein